MAKTSNLSAPERRRIAEQALDSTDQRAEDVLVRVRCARDSGALIVFGQVAESYVTTSSVGIP
ncbi:hypothetical protein [Nocardia rhizosphaerihabitans]|uniref:Uncharacterized protein n=1 Tax=Nocardia rhizosphaerihabitans TaxID=1691570 RepID=A0ABQ2KAF6_9NOCA|nr:hypothetical protein [Nocardia rhizosphaerihabitans]GGN77655.1 hypothetical protein GCM10011610_24310 [Nocardia rhizosphaerihabitans]